MASLADLLRYKDEVEVIDPRTNEIVKKVWLRVLGDLDLIKAYKASRLASAEKRAALRNPESDDYKDEVLGVKDLLNEEKKDLIRTSKLSSIVSEASLAVERPELPELQEVAIEPDAASLEELEKFDKIEFKVEKDYQTRLDEYIEQRIEVLNAELDAMSDEELTELAKVEVSTLVPFSLFLTELNAQKIFLGCFDDQACTKKTFNTIDEFKQLPKPVQEQLVAKMNDLEVSGPDLKN